MVVDRADRDHQPVGDLGVGETLPQQVEHLELAIGEPGRVGAGARQRSKRPRMSRLNQTGYDGPSVPGSTWGT